MQIVDLSIDASRPARFRQAVIFCCDDNYLPYALFAANQIATHHPDRTFDLCLCSLEPLTIPSGLSHLDLRCCVISLDKLNSGFGGDARRTLAAFLRVILPEVFANEYQRLVYLDSDISVLRGGLDRLLNADLGEAPVAAVRDNSQWRTPSRRAGDLVHLGLPSGAYFNSGVLLFDTENCFRYRLFEKAMDLGRRVGTRLLRNDQTLLNAILQGDWTEISPTWNWQFTWASRLFAPYADPHIVHFIGPKKPWNDSNANFPPGFARELDEFLVQHIPERRSSCQRARLAPDHLFMRKMLLKHLLSGRALARYLARFPTDLTVIR